MTRDPRRGNVILSSVFFVFTYLTSYYYAVFLVLLVALFMAFTACTNYKSLLQKSFWKPIFAFSIITTTLLSPFLVLYFQEVRAHDYMDVSSLDPVHFTSADLLDFVVPTRMSQFYHNFFGHLVAVFEAQRISERIFLKGAT